LFFRESVFIFDPVYSLQLTQRRGTDEPSEQRTPPPPPRKKRRKSRRRRQISRAKAGDATAAAAAAVVGADTGATVGVVVEATTSVPLDEGFSLQRRWIPGRPRRSIRSCGQRRRRCSACISGWRPTTPPTPIK
jgi:hypothetical protein